MPKAEIKLDERRSLPIAEGRDLIQKAVTAWLISQLKITHK